MSEFFVERDWSYGEQMPDVDSYVAPCAPLGALNAIANADDFSRRHPDHASVYRTNEKIRGVVGGFDNGFPDMAMVAAFSGPIDIALRMADPHLLKDKRKFYAFLDANPQYLTYDRRKARRRQNTSTVVDGKEV